MSAHEKLDLKDSEICVELLSNVRYISYRLTKADRAFRTLFLKRHPIKEDHVVVYNYPAYMPLSILKPLFKTISGEEPVNIIKKRSSFCQNGPDDVNANGFLCLSVEMPCAESTHKLLLRCQFHGTIVLSDISEEKPEDHLSVMISNYRAVHCSESTISKFVNEAIAQMDETRARPRGRKSPEFDEDGFQIVSRGKYANPAPKKKDIESKRSKAKYDHNFYGDNTKSSTRMVTS
ncbi:unnamed protein product [Auanema sp. JU1783]|nr:unnamed protein product [Auanema sp. JU1783]